MDNEGKKLFFGLYPDRIKASVAATLVREMKEKGETVDAIRKRVYIEHGNKKKACLVFSFLV